MGIAFSFVEPYSSSPSSQQEQPTNNTTSLHNNVYLGGSNTIWRKQPAEEESLKATTEQPHHSINFSTHLPVSQVLSTNKQVMNIVSESLSPGGSNKTRRREQRERAKLRILAEQEETKKPAKRNQETTKKHITTLY